MDKDTITDCMIDNDVDFETARIMVLDNQILLADSLDDNCIVN